MATDNGDQDSGIGSLNSGGQPVICIYIPKLDVKKYMQYNPEDSVWAVKKAVLAGLDVQLVESYNYGLYYPPANGRAGKFLDEERSMSEYPLSGSVGRLELKYKSRVYKSIQDRKNLLRMNSKDAQRKFINAVTKNDVDKVISITDKGLDPNFIDLESGGETPLTLAAMTLSIPQPMMQALVGGGAHLDFRNSQALTAIHRAALSSNRDSIKALLSLGSSANYQDSRGLTPLYYCITNAEKAQSTACVEVLLYDHASVDCVDSKGCTPLHQVCKAGSVKLLDMLIYYGADVNTQNSNGNTPLHICAANDQIECARVLLFRGVNKDVLNYSMFDAHRVASISQNKRVADLIEGFQNNDVVTLSQQPEYNPKRRSRYGTLPRMQSCPLETATSHRRPVSTHAALSLSIFTPPDSTNTKTTNDVANNGDNTTNKIKALNGEQRDTFVKMLRERQQSKQDQQQQQQQQQQKPQKPRQQPQPRTRLASAPETTSDGSHVTKAPVSKPAPHEKPATTVHASTANHYQQQPSHPQQHQQQQQQRQQEQRQALALQLQSNVGSYHGSTTDDGEDVGIESPDLYENINDCISTAEVLKVFDDALLESDVSSPTSNHAPKSPLMKSVRSSSSDEPTDMLLMAESARQEVIQRQTSRTSSSSEPASSSRSTEDHGVQRPVATQRPSVSETNQFKEQLQAMVANRKVPDDHSHPTRPTIQPKPAHTTGPDVGHTSGTKPSKPVPAVKQKSRSFDRGGDDGGYQTAGHQAGEFPKPHPDQPSQRRSDAVKWQQAAPSVLPPPPAAAAVVPYSSPSSPSSAGTSSPPSQMKEDFDLPPPPEEYCNLPAVTTKPTSRVVKTTPQHTGTDPPAVVDLQRELADKFRRPSHGAATIVDSQTLPPPPPGFHDDVPPHRGTSAVPPPQCRTSGHGGRASYDAGRSGVRQGAAESPMISWSTDDVLHWLETLNMSEHCAAFSAACVDGQSLVQLTTDHFQRLGVTQFGQRRMLQRAIESRGDDS